MPIDRLHRRGNQSTFVVSMFNCAIELFMNTGPVRRPDAKYLSKASDSDAVIAITLTICKDNAMDHVNPRR